jgi:hypothetical protein
MIHPKGDIYIDFFLFFNTVEQAGYAFLDQARAVGDAVTGSSRFGLYVMDALPRQIGKPYKYWKYQQMAESRFKQEKVYNNRNLLVSHHKSRKASFQVAFWVVAALNTAAALWIFPVTS